MKGELKAPVLWGLGGALLASTCCVAPLVLALVGMGSAAFLVGWLSLRPLFLVAAALFLLAGLVVMRRQATCTRVRSGRHMWLAPLIMAVCFLGSYNLLNSVVAPRLYQPVEAHAQQAVAAGGVVVSAAGQLVPLRRVDIRVYIGCSGCAATLRLKLLGLHGVHAASVDYQHGIAQILYDPTRTTARRLIASIPNQWYYEPRMQGIQMLSPGALADATQVQAPQVAGAGAALILITGLLMLVADRARRRLAVQSRAS